MRLILSLIATLAVAATNAPVFLPNEVAVILNSGEGTVSLIDRKTYEVVKRYPIGKEPHHLMITPDDKELIVANASSNELVFLDPVTGVEKRRVKRISDPYQLGFSPDHKWFLSIPCALIVSTVSRRSSSFRLSIHRKAGSGINKLEAPPEAASSSADESTTTGRDACE